MDTNLNNNMELDKEKEIVSLVDNEVEIIEPEDNKNIEVKNENENKRKKQRNKFTLSTLSTFLMIFIFTIVSVCSYVPVKNIIFANRDNTKAYIKSNDFIYTLTGLTDYLKQSRIQGNNWYDERYEQLENIKYYMSSVDKTINVSNMSNITEDGIQNQINKSQFYLRIKIDEYGNPAIESSLGRKFNENAFINGLGIQNENKMQYANLDIIYTVPKNLEDNNDLFMYNLKSHDITSYMILILVIGVISIVILSIIAFWVPYSSQEKIVICKLFNKMFLELKSLVWILMIAIFIQGIPSIVDYSQNGSSNFVDIIYNANSYFYLIGIPISLMLYALVYLSIVYIKYIYHTGIKEGFIKNSFTGKVCFYIFYKLKNLFTEIVSIDFSKNDNKKLFIILGINLIALWIIAASGQFGFILAIAYTVFLFKYLLNLIVRVKSLNDATANLAKGEFDISIDENIGILSSIAKNLNNIKDGFKLAVDKEVKSQHMKTELISNVSHDLKTPLTSIITYVDLLRNEDITEDTRKEYVDVLDRKSKRLKVLIEDLFEASKASSGNIDLNLEKVDVVALFRQTLGELEEKINNSTLQIKTNAPENKIICELDGKRTYRIFENIMSNILKYAMPNSRVYIDIEEDEKSVTFIFKNISAYEMNFNSYEITERFTRGDKSRNTDGSGLGLAIAKSLIELQKGNLIITIDGDLFKLTVIFPKV